jgi:hypothetical protein
VLPEGLGKLKKFIHVISFENKLYTFFHSPCNLRFILLSLSAQVKLDEKDTLYKLCIVPSGT